MDKAASYEALVPDTLDLAERARLGVNALTGIVDRAGRYQPNQCGRYYRNPQVLSTEPGGYVFTTGNEMWGKHVESLLEMRLMSGSAAGKRPGREDHRGHGLHHRRRRPGLCLRQEGGG